MAEDPRKWRGHDLLGEDGERLGRVEDIFIDDATELPEWAVVDDGDDRSFVPLAGVVVEGEALRTPFPSALIRSAPRIDARDELLQEDEERLYAHYGVAYSRDGSESGLPEPIAAAGAGQELVEELTAPAEPATAEHVVADDPVEAPATDELPVEEGATVPVEPVAVVETDQGAGFDEAAIDEAPVIVEPLDAADAPDAPAAPEPEPAQQFAPPEFTPAAAGPAARGRPAWVQSAALGAGLLAAIVLVRRILSRR